MNTSISDNKRISFFALGLGNTGAARVMLTLARGFVECGFKVDFVIASKVRSDVLSWLPSGLRVIELKCRTGRFHEEVLYLFPLMNYLRKEQPTALICGDGINFAAIAKRLARVRTRIIVTSHTNLSQYLRYNRFTITNSLRAFFLKRFLWFYSLTDEIVAVSQGVADDIVKLANRPLKRIRTIYNPVVTPELFEQAKEPVDHPWFAPGEPPVLLGVGRLHAQKDFPTLIRAFALVRQHLPARLAILGDGGEEKRLELEALIRELGVTEEVSLPGFVSNPYAFMSKAAVFVLSSAFEGLPTVLIEAMACGTPVVATDCPSGPAEILECGKYGRLVPVGDEKAMAEAILATLKSPIDTEALRQQSQKFSYQTAVESYLELINAPHIA